MNAIFAVNSIDGFGVGNTMPWPRSSADLKRFREITTGHTVVMGAKTWLSDMPKPLPNRRNIVLSKSLKDERCEVAANLTELTMMTREDEQVFIIGGATILWTCRPLIKRVYFTRHHVTDHADIILDSEKYLEGFKRVHREEMDQFTFDIYERE